MEKKFLKLGDRIIFILGLVLLYPFILIGHLTFRFYEHATEHPTFFVGIFAILFSPILLLAFLMFHVEIFYLKIEKTMWDESSLLKLPR